MRLAGDGCRCCGLNPIGEKETLCRRQKRLHFGLKEGLQYQHSKQTKMNRKKVLMNPKSKDAQEEDKLIRR